MSSGKGQTFLMLLDGKGETGPVALPVCFILLPAEDFDRLDQPWPGLVQADADLAVGVTALYLCLLRTVLAEGDNLNIGGGLALV